MTRRARGRRLHEDDGLRKLAAALLGLPVLAMTYLGAFPARGRVARGVATIAPLVVVVGLGLALDGGEIRGPAGASRTGAWPSASPSQGLIADPVSGAISTARPGSLGLADAITLVFDRPMDPASVIAGLRLVPDTAVAFAWSDDHRTLSITPVDRWVPGTVYDVQVAADVLAADGGHLSAALTARLASPARGTAILAATRMVGGRARIDTRISITVDRPVTGAALTAALHLEPAVAGTVQEADQAGTFLFTPASPLLPGATYRATLTGLSDADGIAFEDAAPLDFATVTAPSVVRFRPRDGQKDIDHAATLSVRFTQRMDKASTAKAFSVTANGRPVAGTVDWAEAQTVLVFTPDKDLPYAATVVMTVSASARSRAGAALDETTSGTFKVAAKPAGGGTTPIDHSGGGGAVAGTWASVELYYLKLMNCTRTGGWVTSKGACSSPGGRDVAPLFRSTEISSRVSRPYAKLLATHGWCNHFIGGTPGDRLRRAGFTSYRWAENLGCRSGNPYTAVLGSHLFFQREKPYNGGHYRNLMNPAYDRAGIGVWVANGNVRLCVDFYHP